MRKLALTALLAALLIITACANKPDNKEGSTVFTDAMHRQIAIPATVRRIISMAPSNTEMLFALGLDKEIVGVTAFCNYPEAAKHKQKIGGYSNPSIEAILSLDPDLIVATPDGYSRDRIEKLDSTGIPVFVVNPTTLDGVMETMLTLGKITGRYDVAKQVVKKLRNRIKAVEKRVEKVPLEKRPKVFYEIGHDPLITAGPGTFVDDLITRAGGINIAHNAGTGWPRYSVEAVITLEPDIIITGSHVSSGKPGESRTRLWQKYRTVPAVKNGRIYSVDSDITLRPGPRAVDGLEKLNSLFMPSHQSTQK